MSAEAEQANNNNDEMVSQFLAFTGCADSSRATSYLEMAAGNLETAVGLYMEHEAGGGGGGFGGGGGAMAGAAAAGGGGGDFMSDEAAARALQAEDEVRAPDETRTMRLMDDAHGGGMMGMGMMGGGIPHPEYNLMRDIMEQELASSAFAAAPAADARAAVNAAADAARAAGSRSGSDDDDGEYDEAKSMDDSDDDDEVQAVDASGQPIAAAAAGPMGLSDMFAAPKHLMHSAGGFAGARTVAKDSKRWLLVNIQKDSEFASHALNRDVWRDELVENLVREGFIFWQQMDNTPEGKTYTERYGVQDYPHVAFIDPRTGRLLWRKEGWTQENPFTSEVFAEVAMDFCSRNSFDRPPQAPRPAAASRPTKRPVEAMTEDEQLQAAMRASMTTDVKMEDNDEVQFMGSSQEGEDSKLPAQGQEEAKEEEQQPSGPSMMDELLQIEVSDEPASGSRIQFRMPSGSRVVRKFDLSNNVKTIYAFIAQTVKDDVQGNGFVLMAGFPPADLESDMDKTIDECKLGGQAITVRWKE